MQNLSVWQESTPHWDVQTRSVWHTVSHHPPFFRKSLCAESWVGSEQGSGSSQGRSLRQLSFQLLSKASLKLAVVAHIFNSSTREAEAGRSLSVQGQPGLQREFQDSQGYKVKPCLKKQTGKGSLLSLAQPKRLRSWPLFVTLCTWVPVKSAMVLHA